MAATEDPSTLAWAWMYSTLVGTSGLVGLLGHRVNSEPAIFRGIAEPDATLPYLIAQMMGGSRDIFTSDARLIRTEQLWVVKLYQEAPGDDLVKGPILYQLYQALQKKGGAINGGHVEVAWRERVFDLPPEEAENVTYIPTASEFTLLVVLT